MAQGPGSARPNCQRQWATTTREYRQHIGQHRPPGGIGVDRATNSSGAVHTEPFAGREEDIATLFIQVRMTAEGAPPVAERSTACDTFTLVAASRSATECLPLYRNTSEFLKTVFQQDSVVVYELWNDPGP